VIVRTLVLALFGAAQERPVGCALRCAVVKPAMPAPRCLPCA
jgi:hypothetical protein